MFALESFPGEFYEGDGMIGGGVVKGEVFAWNEGINARDGTAMGC